MVPRISLTLSEADFQSIITDYLTHRKWIWAHFLPSMTVKGRHVTAMSGHPGWPDLACARDGRFLAIELKRQNGQTTPGQRMWAQQLGDNYRLYRPSDWNEGTIMGQLA